MYVEDKARLHNESIDKFWEEMEEKYGETVNIQEWFYIQQEMQKRDFYKKGIAIVDEARNDEFLDYKINMQTYKIMY